MAQLDLYEQSRPLPLPAQSASWQEIARYLISTELRGQLLTGEEIRLALEEKAIGPDHPNSWGGFIAQLVKADALLATGQLKRSQRPSAHNRKNPLYYVKGVSQ